ncbi:MAG: transcription antitermination factor NusB [Alphaproteobacteria bacterium]|nr:transcription antitermination factor NusB [Alphaproteobacteria bacterium]
MVKFVSEKIRMRTSARLAAVQATYMIAYGQLPVEEVIQDFVKGDVGRYVIEEDSLEHEEMVPVEQMDTVYFTSLVKGVHTNKEQIEKSLASYLNEGWSFERMDGTMQALLLCAVYELAHTLDIDAKVIIKEYVDLAYAFYTKYEPKVINALLDQISKSVRSESN